MSREKEMIENQLEAEQEYIVNKLQKQAMGLAAEKQALQLEKTDLKRQVLHPLLTASTMWHVQNSNPIAPCCHLVLTVQPPAHLKVKYSAKVN